jgi:hypothetical protein
MGASSSSDAGVVGVSRVALYQWTVTSPTQRVVALRRGAAAGV